MTDPRTSAHDLEVALGLAEPAEPIDRYRRAELLFGQRKYRDAARELEALLSDPELPGYGRSEAQLLLARACYHAAWLQKAEQYARALVDADPTDAYALALLGRTLERQSRPEASGYLAQARHFGIDV